MTGALSFLLYIIMCTFKMCTIKYGGFVVPGRDELPTSTLSVWRSNQLSYRTEAGTVSETFVFNGLLWGNHICEKQGVENPLFCRFLPLTRLGRPLQKGGVPAAPSGTATLLRLSPNHRYHPRPTLAVTDFRCSPLSWLDGRCVQGPGTYSPRHG